MQLNCPAERCGESRCPITALAEPQQSVAVELAAIALAHFSSSDVTQMGRDQIELLLSATERAKPNDTPIEQRVGQPQLYAVATTAIRRHSGGTCQPS